MKKMKTIFKREFYDNHSYKTLNEIEPECQWVFDGEGVATRKYDGTCCLIKNTKLYRRYDAKNGKVPPKGFIPACNPDPITGHWPGWLEVKDKPEDKWFINTWNIVIREFIDNELPIRIADGTYELCGPHFNNNPEGFIDDIFIKHGIDILEGVERTYEGIKKYLEENKMEGIVFHHPDGRKAKIKRKDFGLDWNNKKR